MSPSVLVLGAGSVGARHARNLARLGAAVTITDVDAERAGAVEGVERAAFSLDHLDRYDGVVVATPTVLHAEHASAAVAAGVPVLVEKPLATSVAAAGALAGSANVMVGYNLRFHDPVCRLRDLTAQGRAGALRHARFWFGSYLPDWRPSIDYRISYSAHAAQGGGVLLDAIHELDLAVWWFGRDLDVAGAVVGQVGQLDIDVEDSVDALLTTAHGVAVAVHLDYLSRRYRRGIEVVGDQATLRLDWARQIIEVEDANGVASTPVDVSVEQSYEREAERFLAWLAGDATPPVDGVEGAASLGLADAIRAAGAPASP